MKREKAPKSFKFVLWSYFAIFAVALMAILWLLQIAFLQTYYEEMKTREIIRAANSIAGNYGTLDLDEMRELSYKDDMFIHIETESGLIIYTADSGFQKPNAMINSFDLAIVKNKLENSKTGTVSFEISSHPGDRKTLVYAKSIEDSTAGKIYLSIFAPLAPLESTVDILTSQLILVTVVSLVLAFLLSFFISRRVTKPLVGLTDSAALLAKGNYDVTFDGGHYLEIQRLAETLEYTSRELAKIDRLQKDLIANVSHDLRTPLTMIKSYAEMVRDLSGDNPNKRSAHLNVIIEEADRLNLLVNDFLMLSQMQSGVTILEPEVFSLKEIASGLLRPYGILVEREAYRIELECEEEMLVFADPHRIKQVLSNFINNAVRYSGEKKEVLVSITRTKNGILCRVIDHGEGIPADELEHIWERYYKVQRNSGDGPSGGSGLGLAIIKEILTLHNVPFGVDSTPGQGSTFWFELPPAPEQNP
ncbi:MAG: HAMP domain-containing sensor histidine kinase [Eubacteriales bacterium]|nr:HAMP domain-containing sensor histidine kinase [Eubacteriales bacterium]